ncbi:helix-turn-helix domain-containing protein [Zobellia amurskyensis]|uniref:Helix-turn-helix domain-containing protein n=1 Tax=Zobellia amurskyensis TaxID=248905 RepID=A0A7X2ZSV8_9FLAO|nr:helix-turn-helix transcriptional regulator [Zobellia amurskyensis]MUH35773.1 helix-turn-helix domain-containing protein [Zobellia amurskyensis]
MTRTKIRTYSKISALADIKIEPFDVNKRYTKPHRHNKYMELVYFSAGSGMHYMDETGYAIEPPRLFIIKKDEVHHWEIDTVPEGFVIIIKEGFLEKTLDKHINLQLKQLGNKRVINPSNDSSIQSLFEIASKEIKENCASRDILVEGVLKALFSKILTYVEVDETISANNLEERFDELLQTKLKNDVAYYAQKLNTTAQNLNALCKRKHEKTASTVIADHILKETKRLLLYTDLSVTEIAYAFDFTDVSHFVKYFKRHDGQTPLQFKKVAIVP